MSDDLNQDIDSVSLLRKDMENLFVLMSDRFEARLQEVESAIEDVEKQVATLVIGYGEQAVFMEALIAQLAFSSPEAQKAFTANVSENRKKMFEAMKEGAPGILGPENEDLASAITNLADQKLSDSN
jgi:hypothetical protein